MSALKNVLGALGGDHHLLGGLQDGVTMAEAKSIPADLLEAIYAMAFSQYQAGKFSEARSLFLYLSFHDHTNPRFLSGFGASCLRDGDPQQAAQVLKLAVDADSRDPGPALNLAHAWEALGEKQKARDALLMVSVRAAKEKQFESLKNLADDMMTRLAPQAGV